MTSSEESSLKRPLPGHNPTVYNKFMTNTIVAYRLTSAPVTLCCASNVLLFLSSLQSIRPPAQPSSLLGLSLIAKIFLFPCRFGLNGEIRNTVSLFFCGLIRVSERDEIDGRVSHYVGSHGDKFGHRQLQRLVQKLHLDKMFL